MSEGTVTVELSGNLARVTQADPHCRISLELLALAKAGEVSCMEISEDDEWLYLSDDYAQQFCYRLGAVDDTGSARWMDLR